MVEEEEKDWIETFFSPKIVEKKIKLFMMNEREVLFLERRLSMHFLICRTVCILPDKNLLF